MAAGKRSLKLSQEKAASQFIDFMPPRNPGEARGARDGSHAAALMYNRRPPGGFNNALALYGAGGYARSSSSSYDGVPGYLPIPGLGLDDRATHVLGLPYAGLGSHDVAVRMERSPLERKLESPDVKPVKRQYARRASTATIDSVIYRQPGPTELEQVVRRAKLSLSLQPQIAELLGMPVPQPVARLLTDGSNGSKQRRQSVGEIKMLKPTLFDGAAGLSTTDLMRTGPARTDMILHESFKLLNGLTDSTKSMPTSGFKMNRRQSLDLRRGTEIAKLVGSVVDPKSDGSPAAPGGGSEEVLQFASSAPPQMFEAAAGMNSRHIDRVRRGFMFAMDRPVTKTAGAMGDEAKITLYGGGPKLVGNARALKDQKQMARRSSIVRTVPKMQNLYDGAAGASSKQLFFLSDMAKTSQFFSENLHFKPVGVPGLGYDAQPKPTPGAAGLSSQELFGREAETQGIMRDEHEGRGVRMPTRQVGGDGFEGPAASGIGSSIYLGGNGANDLGIPDRDPEPFKGAAGLSSSQYAHILGKLADAECMGSGSDLMASESAAADGPPAAASPNKARRGSAIHSEGIAVFGGPELKKVRAERKRIPGGRGSNAWDGLPPAFEGAAGLSSGDKNWLDLQADPVVREVETIRRGSVAIMQGSGTTASRTKSPNARRGSALHSENFAILGGDMLSQLRAERNETSGNTLVAKDRDRQALAWDGMPQAFEGAAGLSSKITSHTVAQGDPHLRSESAAQLPARSEHVDRNDENFQTFDGAAGLTSHEDAHAKAPMHWNTGKRVMPEATSEAVTLIYGRSFGSAGRSPKGQSGGGGHAAPGEIDEPRIQEIPDAYPQAFQGAAGLTSGSIAHAKTRTYTFLDNDVSDSYLMQLEAVRQGRSIHDPSGRVGAYGAGQGDLSGRGGSSPYSPSSPDLFHRSHSPMGSPRGGRMSPRGSGLPSPRDSLRQRADAPMLDSPRLAYGAPYHPQHYYDRPSSRSGSPRPDSARLQQIQAAMGVASVGGPATVHNEGWHVGPSSHREQQRAQAALGDYMRINSARSQGHSPRGTPRGAGPDFTPIQMNQQAPTRPGPVQPLFERGSFEQRRPSEPPAAASARSMTDSARERSFLDSYWGAWPQTLGAGTDRSAASSAR